MGLREGMGALACNLPMWFLHGNSRSHSPWSPCSGYQTGRAISTIEYQRNGVLTGIRTRSSRDQYQGPLERIYSTELKGRPVKLLVQRPLCPVLARMGCQRVARPYRRCAGESRLQKMSRLPRKKLTRNQGRQGENFDCRQCANGRHFAVVILVDIR